MGSGAVACLFPRRSVAEHGNENQRRRPFFPAGHLQHPPGQQAGVTALHSEVTLSKWHGKLDSPLCCLCSFPFSFQVAFCCRSYSRLARKCLLRQHLIFMFSSCGRFSVMALSRRHIRANNRSLRYANACTWCRGSQRCSPSLCLFSITLRF